MTDNKNKNTMTEAELNTLATKIVSRMIKLKSMEDWFNHVSKSDDAWQPYENLKLTEEEDAKCAIVKNRLDEINKILKKY